MTTATWIDEQLKTRADKKWQLMKVELRLSCPDGGGDWRDNLLAQQAILRAALAKATSSTRGRGAAEKAAPEASA